MTSALNCGVSAEVFDGDGEVICPRGFNDHVGFGYRVDENQFFAVESDSAD